MSLIERLNPAEGIADFWQEFKKPTPYRWPILAVSMLMTGALMFLIIREEVVGPPVPLEVTYITSFEPGRSDEEIIASNEENQLRKEARQALIDANEERKKDIYRALARASGMDPDEIERKAAEERAVEEAAEAKRREEAAAGRAAQEVLPEKSQSDEAETPAQ